MAVFCKFVLALPKFHPLHQDDESVIDALLRSLRQHIINHPAAQNWKTDLIEHEEYNTLLEAVEKAGSEAHEDQRNTHLYVFITTIEQREPKLATVFRQWPHNARAVVMVASAPDAADFSMTWFTGTAALAAENRVIALRSQDVLVVDSSATLEQIATHLAADIR